MENSKNFVKILLTSKEIGYLIVNLQDGRIIESGEAEAEQNTFENTYMDVSSIEVGKAPKISYNFFLYRRKGVNREPVWVDLNYTVISIEYLKIKPELKETSDVE